MEVELLETEPEFWLKNDYGVANENLSVDDLKEVFVVCYTIKKKGSKEPEEIYSFTTDFEQAFKRFKLLPHRKCLLKRFMTDDEELIKLAVEGTKPKPDVEEFEGAEIKDILDRFRDEDDEGKPVYDTGFKAEEASEEMMSKLSIEEPECVPAYHEDEVFSDRHAC